jgi:hypothetical protein
MFGCTGTYGCGVVIAILALGQAPFGGSFQRDRYAGSALVAPTGVDELERLRQIGDLRAQREHAWQIWENITREYSNHHRPAFESWYGEDSVFRRGTIGATTLGIRGFSRHLKSNVIVPSNRSAHGSSEVPVIAYTLYNAAAYDHIQRNALNQVAGLQHAKDAEVKDRLVTGDWQVPAFPRDSVIVKTVWWPVARDGSTALPVWDPEDNPPRLTGNGYPTWRRIVIVGPGIRVDDGRVSVVFMGRRFVSPHHVGVDSFYYVPVDANLAMSLMNDGESRRTILIALGREMLEGDYLVLVGANFATRELDGWIWGATWWHDLPDSGPYSAQRPTTLERPWRNYLMQVAFDSVKPRGADDAPHICFNPWLEGRFPDGGGGGGIVSNCMACHVRASIPAVNFLPVRRGSPDFDEDPSYAPGRLRTSSLWSLALHAQP